MLSLFNAVAAVILLFAGIMMLSMASAANSMRFPLKVAAHGLCLLMAANWLIAGEELWLVVVGPMIFGIHVYIATHYVVPGSLDSNWKLLAMSGRSIVKYALGVIEAFCAIVLFGSFLLLFPELGSVDIAYSAKELTEEIGLTREVLVRVAICFSHVFIGIGGMLVATGGQIMSLMIAELREDDEPVADT